MKRILLFTCGILLSFDQYAQNVKVNTSPPVIDERSWMIKQVVGEENGNLYVFNMGVDVSQIECFNSTTLESVYKKTAALPYLRPTQYATYNPKDLFRDHNMFYYDNKIVMLSSQFRKSEKTHNVIAQAFQAKDGTEITQVMTLISDHKDRSREVASSKSNLKVKDASEKTSEKEKVKVLDPMDPNSKKLKTDKKKTDGFPNYTFLQSSDGKNVLVLKHYSSESTMYFKILDFDLKEVASGEFEIAGAESAYASQFSYDGENNIFFLHSVQNAKSTLPGVQTFTNKVCAFNIQSGSVTEYDFGMSGKLTTNVEHKLQGKNILVAGFYATGPGKNGAFYTIIDKASNKITSSGSHDINTSLPDDGLKVAIADILIKPNGEVLIIAEKRNTMVYSTTRTSTRSHPDAAGGTWDVDHKTSSTHVQILYGDIYVVGLGQDNKLSLEKQIAKTQLLNFDSGYASIGSWLEGNDLFIAYNEIKQPVNIMIPYSPKGITICSLPASGEMKTEVIGTDVTENLATKPAFSYVKNNQFYATGKKGKSGVIIRLAKNQ